MVSSLKKTCISGSLAKPSVTTNKREQLGDTTPHVISKPLMNQAIIIIIIIVAITLHTQHTHKHTHTNTHTQTHTHTNTLAVSGI